VIDLDALAINEAKVTYDTARRRHELNALTEHRQGHPIRATVHSTAARRLSRYGPSETTVIREIG